MQDSTRVITNTIILYVKVILSTVVGFFTTRFVLQNLGAEDYGINNIVAGVVAMLSFMSISMTTSTLRFNAYYLGKNDESKQIEVFNSSLGVHLILGLVIVVLLESFGVLFLENVLNIPSGRLSVAKCIFHFVTFSMFITVLSVPYDAVLNAHENMLLFSIVSIIETIIRFGIAVLLFFIPFDKLLFYSIAISFVPLVILILKHFICSKKYSEVKLSFQSCTKSMAKEMFGFTFWNMFGAFSNTCKNQGVAMVINVFYGVVVNAAYGIANQVNGMLSYITGSLQKSLNPLIMKNEGSGDNSRMLFLAYTQCKYSVLLLAIIVLPIFGNLDYLLALWLKDVPEHTTVFCKLILVYNMIMMLTTGIQVAVQAHGVIKNYQIVMGSIILLNLPISYILLKIGLPVESVVVSFMAVELILIVSRLLFAKKLIGLKISDYLKQVIYPLRFILLTVPVLVLVDFYFPVKVFFGFCFAFVFKFICCIVSILFLSCDNQERNKLFNLLNLKK